MPLTTPTVDLALDRYYLVPVLKALLHTILFHRRFTSVERPVQVDLDALGVTYVRLDDPELEATVEEKVQSFSKETSGRNKGQVAIMFFKKRPKKTWFTKSEEEVCWEQWLLSLDIRDCVTERQQIDSLRILQKDLTSALIKISQLTNEQKEHIPAITSNDAFPFQIVLSNTDASWTVTTLLTGTFRNISSTFSGSGQ